jgi:hypothetical protein
MGKAFSLLFLVFSFNAYAQQYDEYWTKWNKNYPETDIQRILEYESYYADSVGKDPSIPPYYGRSSKYRFQAVFLGPTRHIDKSIQSSMRITFKLFIGDPTQLNNVKSEVLMKIGADSLWMPIQKKILKALKKEINIGETTTLYCLYLNEHSVKYGLRNIFIISEFTK